MRFVLSALALLIVQQVFWRTIDPPGAPGDPGLAVPIAAFAGDASTTNEAVHLTGRVVDAAPTWGEGVRLTVVAESVDDRAAEGLVNVSLRETSRRWRTGDRLALRTRLRRITGFGNFGELDWAAYNARRGIFAGGYAWHDEDVEVLPPNDGIVDRLRRAFSESCERAGGQGAEILEALVIGDRTGIDAATSNAVRDAGLAHFLAISGSHMALIVALVVAFVRRAAGLRVTLLERYDVLRVAAVLAALAVIVYGAVCGGGVSVLRSELMALAAMAALWRGRPGDEMRALGGSAIVLALAMPGVGEEAGFQLSYIAVLALIMDSRRRRRSVRSATVKSGSVKSGTDTDFSKLGTDTDFRESGTDTACRQSGTDTAPPQPRSDTDSRRTIAATAIAAKAVNAAPAPVLRALHLLAEAARLTAVCWLVTSPVVAHHFQRISLVAPLANLLAAPLVSAIVVVGIGGLALLPITPPAGDLAVRVGAFLSDLVIRVAAWCASIPMAATLTPTPGPWLTLTLTLLGLAMLLPASRAQRRAAVALAAAAGVMIALAVHDRFRSDRLDVWFASVGQGDAAIVRMPGGTVWVVDEGPPGRGRMVVAPLLRRAWIGRIDVLVASHVQSDHAGALTELLEDFDVGEIWLPDGPCDDVPAARAIGRAANLRGIPVRFVSRDDDKPGLPRFRNAGSEHRDAGSEHRDAGSESRDARIEARAPVFENARRSPIPENQCLSPISGNQCLSLISPEVLWPARGAAKCNDNDQSLVLRFGFAGRSVLFTGDIEAPAEHELASRFDVRADVLKVPHHGSRTSSTEAFLDAVRPGLAVASLGLDNQFHFPAPEVVARYSAHAARFLRMDETGAVHLTIDRDGSLGIETFHPEVNALDDRPDALATLSAMEAAPPP
ncbi:MAG TPA: ComEC/Rec2 family competence protein [Candidatus Limnocylindrales bacterium]|nr:ComEC/Rec2 family competence protein [Candidatus Limnocylindrales bacterium]